MPQDPIRRSGEYRVEQTLGDLLTQIHGSVEKRLDVIVADFKEHADKVDTRLAQGDTTMALINQSLKGVENTVNKLAIDIKTQSEKLRDIDQKRAVTHTPLATPALEPKNDLPWINKAIKKGFETAIGAVFSVILVGIVIWIFKGKAVALIQDPTPAPAPSTAPSPTTPP